MLVLFYTLASLFPNIVKKPCYKVIINVLKNGILNFMLRLHGAIFSCACNAICVALHALEILHRVAMKKFRAIQRKICATK